MGMRISPAQSCAQSPGPAWRPEGRIYTAHQARQESGLSAELIELCQAALVHFSFFQTRVFYSSLVSQAGVCAPLTGISGLLFGGL